MYLRQHFAEMLQGWEISSTSADGRQVQVCETVKRQSLQHQLKAGGAQCIVGQTH